MGLECASCHTSIATSTRAEDNNLPSPQVCRDCHDSVPIKQPRATPVAHFNHQLHTKLRTCVQCHQVTTANAFPAMSTCISCHTQVDIPDSCYKCHAKSMRLTPADHIAEFIDTHSRVKHSPDQKQACEVCHGRTFTCAGCH